MLPTEAALDLGDEGLEEAGGAVVALVDVLALARRVPDGRPGRVYLGKVLLELVCRRGAGMES